MRKAVLGCFLDFFVCVGSDQLGKCWAIGAMATMMKSVSRFFYQILGWSF